MTNFCVSLFSYLEQKEVSIILDSSMPGFRGNDTVESLIHFVEGTEETLAAAASGVSLQKNEVLQRIIYIC